MPLQNEMSLPTVASSLATGTLIFAQERRVSVSKLRTRKVEHPPRAATGQQNMGSPENDGKICEPFPAAAVSTLSEPIGSRFCFQSSENSCCVKVPGAELGIK